MLEKTRGYLLATLPVAGVVTIWLALEPWAGRFDSTAATLLNLGRISGLMGIIIFSLSLILHTRSKYLGLVGVSPALAARMHHNLSLVGFLLMFAHPVLLALNLARSSYYSAAMLLLPKHNLINLLGFGSLWILVGVIIVVDYLVKYRRLWLWIHRLTLVSYLLAVLHIMFVTSDTSRYPVLKYYVLGWAALGIAAFVYQRLRVSTGNKSTEECNE